MERWKISRESHSVSSRKPRPLPGTLVVHWGHFPLISSQVNPISPWRDNRIPNPCRLVPTTRIQSWSSALAQDIPLQHRECRDLSLCALHGVNRMSCKLHNFITEVLQLFSGNFYVIETRTSLQNNFWVIHWCGRYFWWLQLRTRLFSLSRAHNLREWEEWVIFHVPGIQVSSRHFDRLWWRRWFELMQIMRLQSFSCMRLSLLVVVTPFWLANGSWSVAWAALDIIHSAKVSPSESPESLKRWQSRVWWSQLSWKCLLSIDFLSKSFVIYLFRWRCSTTIVLLRSNTRENGAEGFDLTTESKWGSPQITTEEILTCTI